MIRTINDRWKNKICSNTTITLRGYVLLFIFFITGTHNLYAQFSVDAQFRNRFELRDGYQKLAAEGSTPAAFISQRSRLSFIFETKNLKLKFTPQDVRVWGDEQSTSSTGVFGDNSSLELFEAYAEIKTGKSGWLSVGRQQLVYDNQRILAARNWNQSGLAYDAVVYKWGATGWDVHLGSSWNSTGENLTDNFFDPTRIKSLSFIWIKHAFSPSWNVSFSHVASGVTKSVDKNTLYFRQTTGLYTTYKKGAWNAWGNIYLQYGKNQSANKVSAFLIDAEARYKIGNLTPALGFSYLSGNSKTGADQKTDHLFDVLYGARHSFFGLIDYFRSFGSNTKQGGLADYYFLLDYKISKNSSITNTSHYFQLAQTNPTTPNNRNLGYENDLILKKQFVGWGALECGYMFFLPTNSLKVIQGVTNNKFSQFLYLQLTVNPSLFKQTQQL